MKYLYYYFLTLVICGSGLSAAAGTHVFTNEKFEEVGLLSGFVVLQDTLPTDTLSEEDVVVYYNIEPTKPYLGKDSLTIDPISKLPYISLQQFLKGGVAGVYSQEVSAEPGTIQTALTVRGMNNPILSASDLNKNKPLVIVNGIELIENSGLAYNIKNFEIQPAGNASNVYSLMDLDNIESIKVLKDIGLIAKFGPRAANGVIYITTKNASAGQNALSVNGYFGLANGNNTENINGYYEKIFRQPFYDRYAGTTELSLYPSYLSDSTNANYYGASNWTDMYYKASPVYSLNGSLIGGSSRSNFRFFANHTSNTAAADDTKYDRYNGSFYINMVPTSWLTIASTIQATKSKRNRNTSLTERMNEVQYFPNLSIPLSPNKNMYALYLQEYDRSFDNNETNSILGSFSLNIAPFKNFNYSSRLGVDYNENIRDIFYKGTLMDGSSYVSNYFGYNSRFSFTNTLTYLYEINTEQQLNFTGGFNMQVSGQKYNYIQGYNGPSDFIMENAVEGNSKEGDYLVSNGFLPYYYADRYKSALLSGYLQADYSFKDTYFVKGLFRRDGSSDYPMSGRFFNSYMLGGGINLDNLYHDGERHTLTLEASYGRLGIVPDIDHYIVGPYYTTDLSTVNNKNIFSFNGLGVSSRPYSSGWVGYDMPWSYNDMFSVGLDLGVLNEQLHVKLEYYNTDTKDMIVRVPTVAESGFKYQIQSGMEVNNKGVDLTIDYTLPKTSKFGWNSSFNIAYNANELRALPGGRQELQFGDRMLRVGNRIDQFWALINEGMYVNDLDVPVNANYNIMTYNGLAMKAGDPRFKDIDGNFDINDNDRVLMGNFFPKYVGGFTNTFEYGKLDLSFQLYFNLKKDILNQNASRFYDFVTRDEGNSLGAIRDITFWEKNFDENEYPIYNVWSGTAPYQLNQDMFMEDGSFLKLRNLTLGYELKDLINKQSNSFNKFYLYLSASNLFTITKYSGKDPELVNFYGVDSGYSIRMPQYYTLGFKLDF